MPYTATPTNRVLIEARFGVRREEYTYNPDATPDRAAMIPVIEQGGQIPGLLYRGGGLSTATQPYQRTLGVSIPFGRFAGVRAGQPLVQVRLLQRDGAARLERRRQRRAPDLPIPQRRAEPADRTGDAAHRAERQKLDLGIYAQDKWTLKRLTLSYGVRFDHFSSYFPEQTLGPAPLVPTRNITFPETPMASWSDIVPRLGSAYDLFGDGKTALKVSINKYMMPRACRAPTATRQSGEPPRQHRQPELDRSERELRA